MFKNVASQKLIVYAYDATTNTPKTGDAANLTAYVSKDYGSVTVLGDTSATELDATNAKGFYAFDLTQAETNADTLLFSAKSSTANIVVVGAPATVFARPANASALSIDSNGRVDVIKVAGTTQTARDLGASVLLSPGTGTGQINLSSGKVPATVAAGDIANSAITNAALAADTGLKPVRSNTAQAGAATTITLDASASAVDDFYKNDLLVITGGTGIGQARFITGYVGATKVATVATWATNPDNTSTFAILPSDGTSAPTAAAIASLVWEEATAGHTTAGSFGKRITDDLTGDIFARIGAPAGASIAADVAAVKSDTAATLAAVDTEVAAILAAVDTEVAAIKAKTDNLPNGVKKNTALAAFEFFMADSSDHVTGKTGLTITAARSIDGGAFAACANAAAEVANGVYKIDLAATDLNGNVITLKLTSTGADATIITLVTST